MLRRLTESLADRYSVERELGHGGMATVWLATDVRAARSVAIKVLEPALANAVGAERFSREVMLTARLQHPGVVPVLDSGVIPESAQGPPLPWYAMPYIEGESLRSRLERDGQFPIEDALRITADIAGTLQAAHEQGIVHRDIKPENVLLAGDRVYVVDFGIAKALVETGGERLTSTGLALGTPAYMSPEQASAGSIDARSDQYSLATMLYEMLTGEPPFTGASVQMIMARQMSEAPRAIRPIRPSVPPGAESAVMRALERLPADRFPTIAAFAAALGAPERVGEAPRRSRARIVRSTVVAAALALVALAGWLVAERRRQVPASRDPQVVALRERGLQAFSRRTPAGSREAIDAFSAAIRLDSTWALTWAGLAEAYVQAYGRRFVFPGAVRDSALRLAVGAADRAILLDPRSAEAWVARGAVSRMVDPTDLAPSIAAYRRALAIDSLHPRAWFLLGVMTSDNGDLDGGLAAFRRSIALRPSNAEAIAFLALGHYWQRNYDSAAVWADSAVSVDPTYLLAKTTLGQVAVELGDYARARAAFGAARRMATDVEALNALAGLGLVEARAGNTTDAARLLREAEALEANYVPMPPHTGAYLAHAYAALGRPAAAIDRLGRVSPREDLHYQLHLRCDPALDPIAADSAFRRLLVHPRPEAGC